MMGTGLLMDQPGAISTWVWSRIDKFGFAIMSTCTVRSFAFSAEPISESQTGETWTVLACCMMAVRVAIHRRPFW